MLNDVIIDKLSDRLVKRLDESNKYVLEEIGKKLKKIKTLTPEEAEKLSNVLKYGGDYDKIVKKLAKITNINKKDIYKIFDEVAKKDYKFAKQFYDYRKIKFIPYEKNTELKNLVRAIANRTADEYLNIAGSKNLGLAVINPKTNKPVFKVLKDAYNQIIDEAILNVVTGRETFDTMLKRTYSELDKGLQVIYKYKDKNNKTKYYKKNVISAVRQNMTDGLSSLQQEMQKEIGEQFKSDGVEITVVYNPAPDHAEVQGRQFSTIKPSENELSEFEKFQNDVDCHSYDGKFFPAEFEGRDRRSIGQYNCRHLIYSIILGVNKPQYSDEKLQQIIDRNNKGFELDGKHYTNYEGSQLQRRLENEIRKNKVEQISAKARGDMDDVDIAQRKISALNKKYKEVCNAGGFTPRDDLLSVSGYKRVKVNRVTNTTPKTPVDVKYGKLDNVELAETLGKPKEITKPALVDNKFEKTSKTFRLSKQHIDLEDVDNINIYNATNNLNIKILEKTNIKKQGYSRYKKQITIKSYKEEEQKVVQPYAVMWHELGHALDNYTLDDLYQSNNANLITKMDEFFKNNKVVPNEIKEYFDNFKINAEKEFEEKYNYKEFYENYIDNYIIKDWGENVRNYYEDLKLNNKEQYEQMVKSGYETQKARYNAFKELTDMEYFQLGSLSDMFSAISNGGYNYEFCRKWGFHTAEQLGDFRTTELFADFVSLKMTGCNKHLGLFKKYAPDIYSELLKLYKKLGKVI